jgi:hypothetical protein
LRHSIFFIRFMRENHRFKSNHYEARHLNRNTKFLLRLISFSLWNLFCFRFFSLQLFKCLYFNNSYCLKISFMFYSTLELIYYFLYFHLIELYHYWISWFFFDFLCLPLFINLICTNYFCFNSDFSNNLCFFILLTSYY